MATPVLNPKLTKAGLALMPNGSGTGFSIVLTHIAIGTALYAPTGDEVALKQEAARYPIGGGTNPSPTSVQTGVTITDTDPQGRSPNNLSIGEIGWFSNNTLVAVWSRVSPALFVKSPQFDVPFAYTLDISAFPDAGVTVTVGTDPQGMATLILQHEAKADPHSQYVQKVRGVADYDARLTYSIGAKATGPDNKTYRSIVNNNTGNTPASNPTKWERWGHSVAEMDAEFVPRRSALQVGSKDRMGILRVQNPDAAYFAGDSAVTGAFKIAFPDGATVKDSFVRMRVELFEYGFFTGTTLLIAGRVTTANAWENVTVTILGQGAARDFNVRFGNDGAKPIIWIGELASTWNHPRIYVAELMISLNGDGGNRDFWSAGWSIGLTTVFNSVSQIAAGNTVFGQSDVSHVAGLAAALAAKFDKSGGEYSGQVRFAEGTVTTPGISFINDGAPDTGLWHISDGYFGVTTNGVEVVRFGGGVASFVKRPTFGTGTPWDSGNFNPANYLPLAGGIVTGNTTFNASIMLQNGGYSAILRADAGGTLTGLINQAGSAWNFQVRDDGYVTFPRQRPSWKNGLVPWDNENFTPASKQNAGNYMRGGDGADGRYVIGWNGSLQMYVDGTYVGQMWTSANFDPGSKVTRGGRNSSTGMYFMSSAPPNIANISASNNSDNVALTISNDGNQGASAVIQFHREGSWAGYFGVDTDNQWAVGGRSMGNIRYRIWHEGNFNPNNYAPIRNGASASGGYVVSDTNNRVAIQWGTAGLMDCYVDNSYQGGILTHTNFANYVAPRSVMDYGGIGSYTYMNTGANPGANTLVNLPGLGGTWRVMSGAFGANGKDILYVRIG